MDEQKLKSYLVFLAFILFSITLIGLFWLATSPMESVTIALSYAAGLSMIFLPCTFPLVFVIIPLSMGKTPKKGFLMALLFGLGLTITLTFYGIIIAFVGQFFGLDNATRLMFIVAGAAAFVFGLSELKLTKNLVPGFSSIGTPMFIRKRKDYVKAFLLGLFLGNAGIGCPNPAFYILLTYIASLGNIFQGAILGFVHGVGRATPLIFLSILAILGVNATQVISKRIESIGKLTGFALIFFGSFLFTIGLHGMHWWEDSVFHSTWNQMILNIAPALAEAPDHAVAAGLIESSLELGWLTFLGLFFLPILYYYWKFRKNKKHLMIIALIFLLLILATLMGFLTAIESHGHII